MKDPKSKLPKNRKWQPKWRHVEILGKKKLASQWAEIFGIPYSTFINRLNRGYSPEEAVSKDDFRSKDG